MDRICDTSGKRCFASRREAKRALRSLVAKLRIYACPSCGLYHLTKQHHGRDLLLLAARRRVDKLSEHEAWEEIENA